VSKVEIIEEGKGQLVGFRDPDENRRWVLDNKSRTPEDKRMSAQEAVLKFIEPGDFIASGGFGHVRVSMAVIYEIIRQKKQNLIMAGKTAVHDIDLLVASGCVDKVEVAYSFGHELRGLSNASRRAVQTGKCKVVSEISNAAYQWRFLAGMMGIPFIPSRILLGTDTFKKSSAKIITCPFTNKPLTLIPSCNPDVGIIHVHRCDKYGNAQIDGALIEDFELSHSSRRLIVTTEKVTPHRKTRLKPWRTSIPFYYVDAVVEVPYGAHPCQMPLEYFFDEDHISEWLRFSKTDEGVNEYLEKYVYSVDSFDQYLRLIGGQRKLNLLKKMEMTTGWKAEAK
jgi:3-oxoacid CoA-transferase subunit A/glutaconate CoA-transferase subunit A